MPAIAQSPQPTVIDILSSLVATRGPEIEAWIKKAYQDKCPPFYVSLDIRHSGFKLAPVDSNLFPAGFNNLSQEERRAAAAKVSAMLKNHFPNAKKVLLYPEAHTRNLYYLDNLAVLVEILSSSGVEVQLGSDLPTYEVTSASGKLLVVNQLTKHEAKITSHNFTPDLIILNNDLTGGIPDVLKDITQRVLPSPQMGWHTRRKSAHFTAYNMLVHEFCAEFGLDPWLISTFSGSCGHIDFKDKSGLACVADNVSAMLPKIAAKYAEYGIDEKPYVYIKSDYGTYGMGIMTAQSPEDVFEINKKERNKMSMVKGNVENHAVMLQEGVATIDRIGDKPAESVVYCMGGEPLGLFYRTHTEKDAYGSLNSPGGMQFVSSNDFAATPEYQAACALIARLVNVAVTREVY